MATVASDPAAILPPPPALPTRPGPNLAGPENGFSQLLDARSVTVDARPARPDPPPVSRRDDPAPPDNRPPPKTRTRDPADSGAVGDAKPTTEPKATTNAKGPNGPDDAGKPKNTAASDPTVDPLQTSDAARAAIVPTVVPAADSAPAATTDGTPPDGGDKPAKLADSSSDNQPAPVDPGLAELLQTTPPTAIVAAVVSPVAAATTAEPATSPVALAPTDAAPVGPLTALGNAGATVAPPVAASAPQTASADVPTEPATTDAVKIAAGNISADGKAKTVQPAATGKSATTAAGAGTPATAAEHETSFALQAQAKPDATAPAGQGRADAAAGTARTTPNEARADMTGAAAANANARPAVEALPSFSLSNPSGLPPVAAAWSAAPLRAATADNSVPINGVAIEIAARVHDGQRRFDIRLDPPQLGRIDVRLDVDGNGRVTSHLVVDRAETLDLLRRDAPTLERALQSAGLKTDDGALQFSLRDQSFAGREQGTPGRAMAAAQLVIPDDQAPPVDAALRRYGQLIGLGSGIDIRV